MQTIGAFDAKTRFSELLRQAEQGATFEIERRGRPVACLTGIHPASNTRDAAKVACRFLANLRQNSSATPEEIADWKSHGRA